MILMSFANGLTIVRLLVWHNKDLESIDIWIIVCQYILSLVLSKTETLFSRYQLCRVITIKHQCLGKHIQSSLLSRDSVFRKKISEELDGISILITTKQVNKSNLIFIILQSVLAIRHHIHFNILYQIFFVIKESKPG